jgi:hypothetical protein
MTAAFKLPPSAGTDTRSRSSETATSRARRVLRQARDAQAGAAGRRVGGAAGGRSRLERGLVAADVVGPRAPVRRHRLNVRVAERWSDSFLRRVSLRTNAAPASGWKSNRAAWPERRWRRAGSRRQRHILKVSR